MTIRARRSPRDPQPPFGRASLGKPAIPTPADAAALISPLVGARYTVERPLAHGRFWHTYVGHDDSLRRPVVLRVACCQADDAALHQRVERALAAARLHVHRMSQVYDAVVGAHPCNATTPATAAVIVTSYHHGRTLLELDRSSEALDGSVILATLDVLTAEVHAAGLSLGRVTPDHVVLTAEGLAVTTLPSGPLGSHGPTDLRTVVSMLRKNYRRARREQRLRSEPRLTATA